MSPCDEIVFRDNLAELEDRFELVEVPYPQYASGTMYRCKICNSWAKSMESWFACQKQFVTQVVVCSEFWKCGNHWRLKITPDGKIDDG